MRITKRTINVNGCESTTYLYNGNEYSDLSQLLSTEFERQGYFYEKVFGVPWADAEVAAWHPADGNFCRDCDGWQKMLADGGIVRKTVTEEIVDVRDILFPARNEEDENDE